jgi:hypothetical protein
VTNAGSVAANTRGAGAPDLTTERGRRSVRRMICGGVRAATHERTMMGTPLLSKVRGGPEGWGVAEAENSGWRGGGDARVHHGIGQKYGTSLRRPTHETRREKRGGQALNRTSVDKSVSECR